MAFKPELVADEMTPTMQSDGRIVRTYKKRYLCWNDTLLTNAGVLQALGVAQGDTLSEDPLATLRSCPVKRRMTRSNPFAWDVDLDYSTDAPALTSQNADDPTQVRTKRNWTTTEEQRYIIRDRNDNLIVNKLGNPPAGGIPYNVELPMLVYERNEADFSGAVAMEYSGSINASAFSGAAIGTLKLKVTGEEVWEAKHHYWRVRYEMVYDVEGWNPKFINADVVEKNAAGKIVPILDDQLQPITEPMALDIDGHLIPRSTLLSNPAAAIWITVDKRRSKEFQKLGLAEV